MAKKRVERLKGEALKNQLIDVAIEQFATLGYEKTSFQHIADLTNVSQATCLYYFPSKLKLYEEAILKIVKKNNATVVGLHSIHDNGMQTLLKYAQGNISWAFSFPHEAQIILLLFNLASFDEDFRKLYLMIKNAAQEKILAALLAGQREQIFKFDMPLEYIAASLHANLVGVLVNAITTGQTSKENQKEFLSIWEFTIKKLCNCNF